MTDKYNENDELENEIHESTNPKPTSQNEHICREYINLNYKNVVENGKPLANNDVIVYEDDVLDSFLNNDIELNKKETWNRLNKTIKLRKINSFSETLKNEYDLNEEEANNVTRYLHNLLDRKMLIKNNEVVYDKEEGVIEKIPNLKFNNRTRKFVLKKGDKSKSVLSKTIHDLRNKNKKT